MIAVVFPESCSHFAIVRAVLQRSSLSVLAGSPKTHMMEVESFEELGMDNSSQWSFSEVSDDQYEKLSYFLRLIKWQGIIVWMILLPGIIGNILSLFVLRKPALRGVTFTYLFWLAASDLGFLLIHFFLRVRHLHSHDYFSVFTLCRIAPAGNYFFACSSALLITVLAMERHRALLNPSGRHHVHSGRRAVKDISLSFLVACTMSVPDAFLMEVHTIADDTYSCESTSISVSRLVKAHHVLQRILGAATVLVVVFLSIRMIVAFRKHKAESKNFSSSSHRSHFPTEEWKIVRMFLAIAVVFVVCTSMPMIFWTPLSVEKLLSRTWLTLVIVVGSLAVLRAAATFIICCLFSATFRRTLIALFRSRDDSAKQTEANHPLTTTPVKSDDYA